MGPASIVRGESQLSRGILKQWSQLALRIAPRIIVLVIFKEARVIIEPGGTKLPLDTYIICMCLFTIFSNLWWRRRRLEPVRQKKMTPAPAPILFFSFPALAFSPSPPYVCL